MLTWTFPFIGCIQTKSSLLYLMALHSRPSEYFQSVCACTCVCVYAYIVVRMFTSCLPRQIISSMMTGAVSVLFVYKYWEPGIQQVLNMCSMSLPQRLSNTVMILGCVTFCLIKCLFLSAHYLSPVSLDHIYSQGQNMLKQTKSQSTAAYLTYKSMLYSGPRNPLGGAGYILGLGHQTNRREDQSKTS